MAVTGIIDRESEFSNIPSLFFYLTKVGQKYCSPCSGVYRHCLRRAAVRLHTLKSVRIWKEPELSRRSDCRMGIESVNIYWQARGQRCDLWRVKPALHCYLKIENLQEKSRPVELPLPLLCRLHRLSLVGAGSEQVMNPSATSSKTLVNTKHANIFEIVIGAFLGERKMTFLKVVFAPFFLWALTHVANNRKVNVNTVNCFPVPGRGKEWRNGFVLEDLHGLV